MPRDIGSYFDKLTRRGAGGRRLDNVTDSEPVDSAEPADVSDGGRRDRRPIPPPPGPARPTSSRRGGGLTDKLKDLLAKGSGATKSTARKTREQISSRRPKRGSSSRRQGTEGAVTIEYTPRMDGDPDPGEVVWTWVPFEEDPTQGKDRPVVVIGRRGENLVGVPLTSKPSDREPQVSIGSGGWDPKRRTSYARIWRMTDIDEHRTRREGSILDRRKFDAVVAEIDRYYDIRRSPDDYDF